MERTDRTNGIGPIQKIKMTTISKKNLIKVETNNVVLNPDLQMADLEVTRNYFNSQFKGKMKTNLHSSYQSTIRENRDNFNTSDNHASYDVLPTSRKEMKKHMSSSRAARFFNHQKNMMQIKEWSQHSLLSSSLKLPRIKN